MVIIILVSGKAESGKDTFFNIAKEHFNKIKIHRFSFADEVKKIAKLIGWDGKKDHRGITFLQKLSFCAREYDENIWLKNFSSYIKKNFDQSTNNQNLELIMITDCRYKNQIDYLKLNFQSTYTIRINRQFHTSSLTLEQKKHPTETSLDKFTNWDFIIENDSSIDDYKNKIISIIKTIISKHKKE